MRLRRKTNIQEKIEQMAGFIFTEPIAANGRWQNIFGNNLPLHVELGTGKGAFIAAAAAMNPDINYVALEKVPDIIYEAGLKRKMFNLKNLHLILDDVELLLYYFKPNEVERIYLNFIDPWPKTRHEKRRLTHRHYLDMYKSILKTDGEIHLKTDNIPFFDYSLLSLVDAGFSLGHITYDLHNTNQPDKIVMTEYETRFALLGQPICRCEAIKPQEYE